MVKKKKVAVKKIGNSEDIGKTRGVVNKRKVEKVKRIIKKPVSKVKLSPKPVKALREDFEVFAKGVGRLEELKKELDNLYTKGYEAEAGSIKSKLKNVSLIPEIEKEIKELRAKINSQGSYKENKVSEYDGINRKIKELKNEIKKRRKVSVKKQLSKNEVRLVRDIPKIEAQLKNFKEFLVNQEKEEKRKKELLRKIDPSVNFLIDNKFNLSLNEIKAELSKRIKDKELSVKKQLHDDLDARKKNFELQYKDLERKYTQKYQDKVRSSLNREIKNKFHDSLNKKVDSLRDKLKRESVLELEKRKKELDNKERKKLLELSKARKKIKGMVELEFSKKLKQEKEKLAKALKNNENKILKKKEKKLEKGLGLKFLRIFNMKKEGLKKEYEINEKIKKEEEYKKEALLKNIRKDGEKKIKEQEILLDNERKRALYNLNKKHEKLKSLIKAEKQRELEQHKKELEVKITKEQFEKLRQELIKEFESKKENLKNKYNDDLIEEKGELEKHFNEEILVHKTRLNNKMHEHLTGEVQKLHDNFEIKKKEQDKRIDNIEKRLEQEKGFLSRIKDGLNSERNKIRNDKENYKMEIRGRLEKEKQEAIKKTVAEQSVIIRQKLRNEFNEKLKLEVQAKKAEFEKRKADLALDIQRKAKDLFS